MGGNP
jgi:hypothetical protein